MLTADQRQAIKDLLPQIQEFLGTKYDDSHMKQLLEIAFEEGYLGGMVKMELFALGNVEGLRVQYGNVHKYFHIKTR